MIEPTGERRPPISPQLAWRVAVFGGIAFVLFAIVFFRLWYLQVLSGDQYLAEANDNQVRQERIQAPRGDVVDRNGDLIVTNRRAIVVEISPSALPERERELAATWGQRMSERALRPDGQKGEPVKIPDIPTQELRERLRRLADLLGDTTATEIQRRIIQSLAQVPYAPVRVETDVPRAVMNYVQERQKLFAGVTVEQVYVRQYPERTLAAQLLGTVGEIQLKQLDWKHFRGVKQGTVVGQGGLEYQYDRYLRGIDGSREIQVDALGNPKGELRKVAPQAGQRLKLSLDLGLQKTGQDALTGQANPGGQPAAFVAMNPDNGEILGMGSYPSFDPNLLTKPITQEPMRSISMRAGCCRVPKNSGSAMATRSTGICRRANHTRAENGMRSSARMAWNISATISTVALSAVVGARFLSSAVRRRRSTAVCCISVACSAAPSMYCVAAIR